MIVTYVTQIAISVTVTVTYHMGKLREKPIVANIIIM